MNEISPKKNFFLMNFAAKYYMNHRRIPGKKK